MVTDQLEEMTDEQLKAMIIALREALGPIQEKLAAIQKVLEEREDERKWDELFALPTEGTLLEKLEDEAIAEYLAGETEEGGFDGL
jgi:hypothetical protein